MDPRARFDEIVDDLAARDPDVQAGQMMGRPCIKAGGKIIAGFEAKGSMVFKLPDESEREQALALAGAQPFDPMGTGRVMKEWVDVPLEHEAKWADLAATALRLRKENVR
jgi:hypothetical protein